MRDILNPAQTVISCTNSILTALTTREAIVMDFSASEGCHQPIHQVPRRSSVSSEHSFKLRFSTFFSFTPARARLFCFGMLALLLTLPCTYRVGAVTFVFNGFQESDVHMVSASPWTFQSNTSCLYFDPPRVPWYSYSVSGRFLYPHPVQMKDPITKRVKSFRTTFIYRILIRQANHSSFVNGPGMSFIVVPDNVTLGASEDYMGLFTTDTSATTKNYASYDHILGVELDTFMNPEFNDCNDNHIGVNLASMNSTFIVFPFYPLASFRTDGDQIWIDYFEPDPRMDIYYAAYTQSKPARPQGSLSGVDLSLLLENMYIGFSPAKGIKSDNVPYVYAWSFSNDGIPAPSIVMGLDATAASPPADCTSRGLPLDGATSLERRELSIPHTFGLMKSMQIHAQMQLVVLMCEFLKSPNSPPKDQSFTVSCQGWSTGNPTILKKQHDYELKVKFVAHKQINDFECYTNVRLAFFDGDYLLGEKYYSAIEVQKVYLVEKLFHCFSNLAFGGYVEKICSKAYCSTTFVAHCPRFINICHKICNSKSIPKLLVASRRPGSKVIVGVPFWSSEL